MKISWSQAARRDIRSIKRYIAQDSPFYAKQFCERLTAAVDQLTDFPQIGRRVPEVEDAPEDIRELIFRNYRILYLVEPGNKHLHILAIIHGARDLGDKTDKPWG